MQIEKNLFTPTELFSRKLDQIKNNDPKGYGRIMKVIERLLDDPDSADGKMQSYNFV